MKTEKDGYLAKVVVEVKEMAARESGSFHTEAVAGHEAKTMVDYGKEKHFGLVVIGFMGQSIIYDRVWRRRSQNIARLVAYTVMVKE